MASKQQNLFKKKVKNRTPKCFFILSRSICVFHWSIWGKKKWTSLTGALSWWPKWNHLRLSLQEQEENVCGITLRLQRRTSGEALEDPTRVKEHVQRHQNTKPNLTNPYLHAVDKLLYLQRHTFTSYHAFEWLRTRVGEDWSWPWLIRQRRAFSSLWRDNGDCSGPRPHRTGFKHLWRGAGVVGRWFSSTG